MTQGPMPGEPGYDPAAPVLSDRSVEAELRERIGDAVVSRMTIGVAYRTETLCRMCDIQSRYPTASGARTSMSRIMDRRERWHHDVGRVTIRGSTAWVRLRR